MADSAPSALHLSDSHLRVDQGDTFYAFRQAVDIAIASHVAQVIGAGDLIDRQTNRPAVIVFLAKQLARLEKAGIDFLFVQGQHDADAVPWPSLAPNAIHLHRRAVATAGDRVIYGIDWQPYGRLQEELADVPSDADILVAHQVWGDWMGELTAPQGEFAQVPAQISLLHTGDLHEWKLEAHANAGGPATGGRPMKVLSCGATTQLTVAEPSRHYCALLRRDGTISKVPLKSRPFVEFTVLTEEAAAELAAILPGRVKQLAEEAAGRDVDPAVCSPLIRVVYAASLDAFERRVEAAAAGKAILRFKALPPPERVQAYQAAKERLADRTAVTPQAVLREELDRDGNPEVYALCERLLAQPDKAAASAEFARWRQEFLGEAAPPLAAEAVAPDVEEEEALLDG